MQNFGVFDPITYAFRAFFKHIWLMLFCMLAIIALGIITTVLLIAINWPVINYVMQLMQQAQPGQVGVGMMGGIGMMNGMVFPAMSPEMMREMVSQFLPYLIASAVILFLLVLWMWAGVCNVALEVRDTGKSSAQKIFSAIRFIPKLLVSYSLLLVIPIIFVAIFCYYGGMFFGSLLAQLLILLFFILVFLPFSFTNFYIIDKKSGPIAALTRSFALTISGGLLAYGALLILVVLLFPINYIPIIGSHIVLLLMGLGFADMYRKLGV